MPIQKTIHLSEFDYELPNARIAKYPLAQRDRSKLLVYRNGNITDRQFFELPQLLTDEYSLFFNNTKVLPARLPFRKETGAKIEIFLLEPLMPSPDPVETLSAGSPARWEAMIGNARKFKVGATMTRELSLESGEKLSLTVQRLEDKDQKVVELSWEPSNVSLAEVLERVGQIPLPPYLGREAESQDAETYQTVYSEVEGAVAAPTAGLHFTPEVLSKLKQSGVSTNYLTLHVGAGTFRPVQTENALDHPMHRERMVLTRENVEAFAQAKKILTVGTTSLRTLESLYWYGVKLLREDSTADFFIEKLEIYPENTQDLPSRAEAGAAILAKMDKKKKKQLSGETEIMIFPGYKFRSCDALLTNFHQPQSTLILLVAALVGEDWRKIYQHALDSDYRFLSYGDSSLLFSSDK